MFENLRDEASLYFWHWWPTCAGEITQVRLVTEGQVTLCIEYKFSLGNDGPYTGEYLWEHEIASDETWLVTKDGIKPGLAVTVRYRPDNPSVNTLDPATWDNI